MHCWLFWRVLVLSLILIEFSECCPIITDRPIKEVLKKNEDSPYLVLIADKTIQEHGLVRGLSYGAIIKSDVILTLAAAVFKTLVENLVILTNCLVDSGIKCDTYPVASMKFSDNFDPKNVNEDDPVIIRLSTPLEFSATVSPVRLPSSNDDFDPDNCVIHHWQPVVYNFMDAETEEAGILNAEFKVSVNPDHFGMSETEEAKLLDHVDCFIERCLSEGDNYLTLLNTLMQKINFMGSPIVCKLRNADDRVLKGFSTYTYEVDIDPDKPESVSLISGTLVEFSSDSDDFFDEIIKNQAELK